MLFPQQQKGDPIALTCFSHLPVVLFTDTIHKQFSAVPTDPLTKLTALLTLTVKLEKKDSTF